ncbi:hypothetical protein K488DRAFT_52739 [Vararia minispora EC-137]|uniref:Uncharacterized protein n=1 Tax=Vararia minispora EC-137 TaxID=1314806 RepID=A0ACB8QHR6_9AGAM|nr:hypothetical protein K488DRAFT_52739 [Vararia minispora EC-137]
MPRPPYHGSKRRLVLAFDLGTTYSGVSYALLDPGKPPVIHSVTRFPGQDKGDAMLPTIVHYDKRGRLVTVGAEEPLPEDDEFDEDIQFHKLQWFKLLLRSSETAMHDGIPTPQLPVSMTIVDVYADFYRYLFDCSKEYIKQTHAMLGDLVWSSIEHSIDFVLTHPNGWDGAQQGVMRRAMIKAGLVPDTRDDHDRVKFVTEGEASLLFCINGGLVAEEIKNGSNIMIIDAGGGTVDLSSYTFTKTSPMEVREIAIPGCIFEGSVIVRQRAENYLRAKLRNSRFGSDSYVAVMAGEFDKIAKKRFRGTGHSYIKFGQRSDRDATFGIRGGQIKLSKEELSCFFDPGIEAIFDAVDEQRSGASPNQILTYFLVGGFSANEYLFARIQAHLLGRGAKLYRPDGQNVKAVAVGAVSFFLDHYVSTRKAKFTYGTSCGIPYDACKHSHRERAAQRYRDLDDIECIPNAFGSILRKGCPFSLPLLRSVSLASSKQQVTFDILAHQGSGNPPEFLDEAEDSIFTLCKISAELSKIPMETRSGLDGPYYHRQVDVVISFGTTDRKVELAWTKNVSCHIFFRLHS